MVGTEEDPKQSLLRENLEQKLKYNRAATEQQGNFSALVMKQALVRICYSDESSTTKPGAPGNQASGTVLAMEPFMFLGKKMTCD